MASTLKRVLLFTAKLGYQTRSFHDAAQKLGVELTYVTDRCHQLDDPWNDRALAVHFESPDAAAQSVLDQVRHQPVHAVLALGDRPLTAASYVARGLGIPYNHPASVDACRSKLRMREVFRDAGLRSPWFQELPIHPAPEPALLGISYPCVLKPISLSASQGVIRVNNRDEFMAAADRIRRLLESPELRALRDPGLDQMIAEAYIPGKEVAVEGLLTAGQLRLLAIFDKPDPLEGPFFEETIYVTPSRLSPEEQRAVETCARDAARALGLSQGPLHAEFRINQEGVWPLEVAPRPIGGLCARALRFTFSESPRQKTELISLEELLLRHALEFPGYDSPREPSASAVMMIPVPASGIFSKVTGQQAALAVPGITELLITARLHDYIAAWPEGSSYLGFIFSRAENMKEAEQALRTAHAKLTFTLTPRLPIQHPGTEKFAP